MTRQWYVVAGALVLGLAVGRFSLPAKIVTKIEIHEVERKKTDTDKTDHSTTVVTETKHVDGSITKVTETKKDIDVHRKTDLNLTKDSKSEKTVEYANARWSINGLAMTDLLDPGGIVYGGQVEYRLLGPIRTGFFGFTNGMFGISLGVQF